MNNSDEPFYDLKEEDIKGEVKFQIDENSFNGPFTCHDEKTVVEHKSVSYNGLVFSYSVWKCKKCKKEYLDASQGKRFDQMVMIKQMLEGNLITMQRNMNFDGKAFFFRFPKELSLGLRKEDKVELKLLSADGRRFLVEVKPRHNLS